MNELSLFTGAGGGLLGTSLLGWNPIGYVEWNEYCQRVIAARIADGYLPAAPIFTDVREFVQSGAAAEYRGVADVVTGGFPCQPFSLAGKQLGAADSRNMWPATIAVIRAVRPRFAFMENVSALITSGYFGTILGDLAESGYDCRWRILSAGEMGAPHLRQRVWIVAINTDSYNVSAVGTGQGQQPSTSTSGVCQWENSSEEGKGNNASFAHPASTGCKAERNTTAQQSEDAGIGVETQVADIPQQSGNGSGYHAGIGVGREQVSQLRNGAWKKSSWGDPVRSFSDLRDRPDIPEPLIRGVDNGMAYRVERLRAIGNGQVPATAAAAWRLLTSDLL